MAPSTPRSFADLASAETLSAVQSEPVLYSGGYGYEIRPGTRAEWITRRASDFLSRHKKDVDWVLEKFGMFNSAELEIAHARAGGILKANSAVCNFTATQMTSVVRFELDDHIANSQRLQKCDDCLLIVPTQFPEFVCGIFGFIPVRPNCARKVKDPSIVQKSGLHAYSPQRSRPDLVRRG